MPDHSFDIVTLTLNPAIDRTVTISDFAIGVVNRARDVHSYPAGKGVNVASAIADYGLLVGATGFLGLENAGSFEALFTKKNISDHFVRIAGQTRVSIKIADPIAEETTELNFPGLPPALPDLAALHEQLAHLSASWFVLSGSLPESVPTAIYGEIIATLKSRGIRVALDASGEALAHGVESAPDLIKPNLGELEELAGHPLPDRAAILAAARQIIATRGVGIVVVSRGAEGALYITAEEALTAAALPIAMKSTVGAGDALLAGTVAALKRGQSLADSARLGTAFAVNALSNPDRGLSSRADVEFLARQVEVNPF